MGNEWGPVVLNDAMELEFIRQAQKGFNNDRSYWVSGTTNVAPKQHFQLNSYINGDTGN